MGAFQEMRQAEIAETGDQGGVDLRAAPTHSRATSRARCAARDLRSARTGAHELADRCRSRRDAGEAALLSARLRGRSRCRSPTPRRRPSWRQASRRHAAADPRRPGDADPAGRARTKALEERLGVPVVGMESPRGVADPCARRFRRGPRAGRRRAAARQEARLHPQVRQRAGVRRRVRVHAGRFRRSSSSSAVARALGVATSLGDPRGHVPGDRSACGV